MVSNRSKMIEDGSKTLQGVANTVSNAHKTVSRWVVEAYMVTWFLKDVWRTNDVFVCPRRIQGDSRRFQDGSGRLK